MTYSIVARDPQSGELGVAVQSHWFSVGPIVPWARPGVGAVATQANADPSYGPRLLDLLASGVDAPSALEQLVAADSFAHGRQVAVVDAAGRVAAFTGGECMTYAGDVTGDGVSCQANIMASATVWGAMLDAFESTPERRLQDRLLAALDAAEAAGGDVRGRQSAAILVVPADGEPWESTVSLRVEDHGEPLVELRRLIVLHDAYVLAGQADALVGAAQIRGGVKALPGRSGAGTPIRRAALLGGPRRRPARRHRHRDRRGWPGDRGIAGMGRTDRPAARGGHAIGLLSQNGASDRRRLTGASEAAAGGEPGGREAREAQRAPTREPQRSETQRTVGSETKQQPRRRAD